MRRKKRGALRNGGVGRGAVSGKDGSPLAYGEEHFRKLIENALDLVMVLRADGTINYASPSVMNLLGYESSGLTGRNIFDYLHPEEIEMARSALAFAAGRPGVTRYFELRVRHCDGSWRRHETSAYNPIGDPAIGGLVINSRDITKRKRLEEELKRQEEHFRALIDNAADVITVLEADGTIRYESPSVRRLLGWAPEELAGRNIFDFLHPEDLDVVQEAFRKGIRMPGNSSYMEVRFRHKDGSWRWFGGIGSNLLQDPAVHGILLNSQEITERVEAELALTDSRRALAALMSNLPGMAYRCRNDRDWTTEFVSEGCLGLTGYRPDDLIDNRTVSYGDLIHPDDGEAVWNGVQRALERRAPFELTYRIRTASGDEKWVWEQGSGVFSEDGEVLALEGFITDITDYMRAQRLLRVQRDLALQWSGESDLDRILRESLQAVLETTGMDSGSIYLVDEETGDLELMFSLGLPEEFMERFRHLDAASLPEGFARKSPAAFERMGDIRPEVRDHLVEEGLKSIFVVPLSYEGRTAGLVSVSSHAVEDVPQRARDIVEVLAGQVGQAVIRARLAMALRKSEEQYRATFESTGTAMFLVDRDAMLSHANAEMEKIFGYSLDEVIGRKPYMDLVMPEDVDEVKSNSLKLLRGELESPITYEIKARHKSGRPIDALMSVSMLPGMERSVVSLIDITEKKRYERQLEEYAQQMRDFLDIAAHELRHPATLLKGYAMTLARRGKDIRADGWFDSLQGIVVGADRLVHVVEELLDASRLQRGGFTVKKEEASPGAIAANVIEEMRTMGTGRRFSMDVPDDLGTASVDPERLLRLFVILMDNAVKYSSPASVVELKGERREGEMVFSVLDRGVGIPPEDRERVFERFYQVGDALHHSGPGLGLGLYIGKRIVEAHGGRIWYEPREGGGSVFSFSIPL